VVSPRLEERHRSVHRSSQQSPSNPLAGTAPEAGAALAVGDAAGESASSARPSAATRPPAIVRLLAAVPLRPLHVIGAVFGCLVYALSPRYRRCLRGNLQLALPQASLAQRMAAAAGTGRGAVEGLRVLLRPPEETAPLVREALGWEAVEHARHVGHGILLISAHLGCFEIFGPFKRDRPLTAFYRPHRNATLQSVIAQGRGRYAQLAPAARSGVRAVLSALRRGEMVLMLPDQVPAAGEGVWEDFFGRPAYTMTLAARLTEVPGVRTFLYYGERLPRGAGFRLHFLEPDPPLAGDTRARVAAINRNVEKMVLRNPDQYLWGYNRYKTPKGVDRPATST
jgi:Kdo2-lipid IVA lauroyltransferase/acyltransferase